MVVAGLFPGQGSQSVGMLSELAQSHHVVRDVFQQASDVLQYDLWALVQQGSDADLAKTEVTQPAMLSAGVAVWRVWQQQGGTIPQAGAGHSLGEYSALVAAGSIDFLDAVQLVAQRARLMQQAVPEGTGAMAAVLGLDDDAIKQACAQAEGIVEAVNFNSPGQVVIAGEAAAVEQALAIASELGAKKAVKLPVSVPSHCQLMQPAAEALAIALQQIKLASPTFQILHNVDAMARGDVEAMRVALAEQLYRPVMWVDTIQQLRTQGADVMLEFGPGKVLTGLNRRIERRMSAAAIFDNASLEAALKLCEESA